MMVLVVSDFHLGKGKYLKNGQLNILEDFGEDNHFIEFLKYYCSPRYADIEIHLVLNGDILNLIQIDVDGIFTHLQTEDFILAALKGIVDGHVDFFRALREFMGKPKRKITYVIGNHDFGMVWPKAQEFIRDTVGEKIEFTTVLNINGIHIEHGHRYETLNSVPPSKTFVDGPNGFKILNLPWASLFCLSIIPVLKKERPFIDKVRPLSLYIRHALFNDTFFFFSLAWATLKYLIKTNTRPYLRYNKNFRISWKPLKKLSIYPKFDRFAKGIFNRRRDVSVVIMGHTHIAEWRRFPEGRLYFNTGTWNSIPSIDAGIHENITKSSYVCIELQEETGRVQNAYLNVWHGHWRPFVEESSHTISSF